MQKLEEVKVKILFLFQVTMWALPIAMFTVETRNLLPVHFEHIVQTSSKHFT